MGDPSLVGIVDTITLEPTDPIMSMGEKRVDMIKTSSQNGEKQRKRQKKKAISPGIEPDVGVELSCELARESNIKM